MSITPRTGLKAGWIEDLEPNPMRRYKNENGQPCSLNWLVKNEPEWAVNQIRHRDGLELELADWKRCAEMLYESLNPPQGPSGEMIIDQLRDAEELFRKLREAK